MSVKKPNASASTDTYAKVANFTGLYRHTTTGNYLAVKKNNGKRKERSLQTADRKIAERRFKEWTENLDRVNVEVEKTTLRQLLAKFEDINLAKASSTRIRARGIIKCLLEWWPYGRDIEVRQIRPSYLDEWLARQEGRLRNTSYNEYTGFLKQLFEIAVNPTSATGIRF